MIAGLLAALVLNACPAERADEEPRPLVPIPSVLSTTSTTRFDLSQVALAAIPGSSTTTMRTAPGLATVSGTVLDASGQPVEGALVRGTWHSAPAPVVVETLSGPGGAFRLEQLQGGRWRFRAFMVGLLASTDAPEFFLGVNEAKGQDLRVESVDGLAVTAKIAPDPFVGEEVELAVKVFSRLVDAEGRVKSTPVAGTSVTLVGSGWSFSPEPRVTTSDGVARWAMRCVTSGNSGLAAQLGARTLALSLPPCGSPEATSTTTRPPAPSTTTTTTRPGTPATRATTTTTRPRSTTSTTRRAG
ncbi:MAG: carboxypeptidase-like regulatory domain-containing protein [Acidimicrobiia bacterium]